ncbi:MAG: aspartate/glutamate racemase family protein [Paracoccaceae bacterium]
MTAIHVVNPNASGPMTEAIAAAARASAPAGVEIVASGNPDGPPSIEGHVDGALAVPGLLGRIAGADAEGVAAHVIACFDDTGLDAARSVARAPVVGIGEAAAHVATLVGERFGVVTSMPAALPVLRANLERYGLAARCAGLRAAGVPVLEIAARSKAALDAIRREAEAAVETDGADVLVLGCAGMAWLAERLSEETGVPVVEGIAAGVGLAATLVGLGLSTSKRGGYAPPRRPIGAGA